MMQEKEISIWTVKNSCKDRFGRKIFRFKPHPDVPGRLIAPYVSISVFKVKAESKEEAIVLAKEAMLEDPEYKPEYGGIMESEVFTAERVK